MSDLTVLDKVIAAVRETGVDVVSVRAEWPFTGDPWVKVVTRTRSDFEALTKALGLATEDHAFVPGQRKYETKQLAPVLVECVSFRHHADWVESGAVSS